jgi:hypothetical protein
MPKNTISGGTGAAIRAWERSRRDTTLSVDIKTAERLRELAREDDRTIASMIRILLKNYENEREK